MSTLKDKHPSVAIVTGGSSGIGAAVSERLGRHGATVYVVYHGHPGGAEEVVENIRMHGGNAHAIKADVSKESDVSRLFARVLKAEKQVDILVNSAGIENYAPILKMKTEDWDRVMNVNLRGAFLCSRAAAQAMVKLRRGSIVNISSVHEVIPWGGYAHYCAAKAGLMMLTKTMAQELGRSNVRVNNVCPGAIDTPINQSWTGNAKLRKVVLEKIPDGRLGKSEEVAGAVAYLVSEEASYITGTSLFIDGGMTLYASFLSQG